MVEEECNTTTLHHDMDIFRLMECSQQIEDSKLRIMNGDGKRAMSDEPSQPMSK